MQTFIARQPIFDGQQKVHAYELMYRSGPDNWSAASDDTAGSTKVIADMCLMIDGERLTEGKKAFIKVTRDTLVNGYAAMLPAKSTVVELQDDVEPREDVIDTCAELKRGGYTLALDVCSFREHLRPLAELADVIKVDFLSFSEERQQQFVGEFSARGKQFAAYKVETPDAFRRARAIGYNFFQGYFLSRPEIVAQKDIPTSKLSQLRLIQEINRSEINDRQLEAVIKQDVSLSFKLLRHINSASFGLRTEVHSIKQALALLGEQALKRWASLIAFAGMAADKPEELMITAATRAKFCEAIATKTGIKDRAEDMFLIGMFSMLDAILDRHLHDVLKEMPLAADAKDALLGVENPLRDVFDYELAYEQADWAKLTTYETKLDTDASVLPELYIESLNWASKNLRGK